MSGRNHRHKKGPWRRGELPTTAVVHAAARAASNVVRPHAHPNYVLGITPNAYRKKSPEFLAISHARIYAAFALRAIYEEGRPASIAEMFGVRDPQQWMSGKDNLMKTGGMAWWWDDAAFMKVIEETEKFIIEEKNEMWRKRLVEEQRQEAAE